MVNSRFLRNFALPLLVALTLVGCASKDSGSKPQAPQKEVAVKTQNNIVIATNVNFGKNAVTFDSTSQAKLNRVARILVENPSARVRIEGHTDQTEGPHGLTGDSLGKHQKELSQRRARSVGAYLTQHGVAAGRLSFVGFGASKPLVSNRTTAGRAVNHRAEFTVIN